MNMCVYEHVCVHIVWMHVYFLLILMWCGKYLSILETFALLRDKYDIIENVLIYYFLAKSLTVI